MTTHPAEMVLVESQAFLRGIKVFVDSDAHPLTPLSQLAVASTSHVLADDLRYHTARVEAGSSSAYKWRDRPLQWMHAGTKWEAQIIRRFTVSL